MNLGTWLKASQQDSQTVKERRVKISKDTWERVRIEFEFQTRNFGSWTPPYECDVIVCWTNNWPDSPVEVLELSSAIQELEDDV